ncbi:hypothetical protein ILYODFUR_038000, partial [Ilyodon furcidens]
PEDEEPLYPPPPAYNPQPDLNRSTSVPTIRVPSVSEDVAREALLKFVESKWKYSSKPARNLTFKDLKPVMVYRYRLETYTETRTSAWHFEPYNGKQSKNVSGVTPDLMLAANSEQLGVMGALVDLQEILFSLIALRGSASTCPSFFKESL